MDAEKQSVLSKKKKKEILVQLIFGLIAQLVNIAPGMSLGYSAVALPSLQNENATFYVTEEEASWIASIASISTPIGCIISGSLLDRLGRKMVLVLVNFPCLLGWLFIAFANGNATLILIYVGRFFTGLATGMASVPATVYSAEMSTDSLRGMFVTWTSISISVGILLIYVLGYVLPDNWRMMAGLTAIFPVCGIIFSYFFCQKVQLGIYQRKNQKSRRSYEKIRGISKKSEMPLCIANEFQKLSENYRKKLQESKNSTKNKNLLKMFLKMETVKPFIIMNFFLFSTIFRSICNYFYATKVVQEAGITWDPYIVSIFIGLTRVIVTILMSYISKQFGRRPPSVVSGSGMTICMGCLAIYLYLQKTNKISEEAADIWGWIPVTSLMLYILTSTIGFLTLPWAMIGEVFPSDTRGIAAGLTTCIAYIFNFIVVKVYPDMIRALTEYGLFFFYGAVSLIGTIFVIILLPETHGKTLLEMEEYFNKKKAQKSESREDGTELIISGVPVPTIMPKKS